VVVFSSDTGPSASLSELAKGADVLVTEVTSAEELKEQRIKTGIWQRMTSSEQEKFASARYCALRLRDWSPATPRGSACIAPRWA
jgi:hypothetical protein